MEDDFEIGPTQYSQEELDELNKEMTVKNNVADYVLYGLQEAKKNGLLVEVLDDFIHGIKTGDTLQDAIFGARREWDI